MPWWSWVLIWLVLVLALAGMLIWFAVSLFRKLMTAVDALGELGDQVGALDANLDEVGAERFQPAVFGDRAGLAATVEQRRADAAHRRQLRIDRRVKEGKLLQQHSLIQRTEPHA